MTENDVTDDMLPLAFMHQGPIPRPGRRCVDAHGDADDAAFRAVRRSVLERDGDACRFCGFRGRGPYMNIHHLDGNHANNDPSNLVAACFHCHAAHHIGLWGTDAAIVWLPEISQRDLSHLSRALMVAQYADSLMQDGRMADAQPGDDVSYPAVAWRMRGDLARRADIARDRIGDSDPLTLATVMAALSPDEAAGCRERLVDYRFVLGPTLVPRHHAPGTSDPGYAFASEIVKAGYSFRDHAALP